MTSFSSADSTTLIVVVVVILILARRVARMVSGAPVSTGRLFGYAAVFLGLFVLLAVADYAITPWWLYAAMAAAAIVVAVAVLPWVERSVEIYRGPLGQWYYRLGVIIPALYVALFAVRIVLDFTVLGLTNPFGASVSAPTGLAFVAFAVVNILFAASTGMLVGRSVGVYRALQKAETTSRAIGTAGPPAAAPPLP